MLLPRRSWALALTVASASAFRDTSPFFLFSSSPISSTLPESNVARAETVKSSLTDILKSCDWATYVVVSQPSVSSQDFTSGTDSTPHLNRWRSNTTSSVQSALTVSEVLGDVDEDKLVEEITQQCKATIEAVDASADYLPVADCGKATNSKRVIKVSFAPPPHGQPHRADKLREHDSFLNALVSNILCESVIVIYTTTPTSFITDAKHSSPHHDLHLYDNEDPFHQALHMDLKRDFAERQASNKTLPLFETYQYFTPAIFMGGLVLIALFLILYVGVSAVAGVEVSYFAFSKEMGPAAQKKQQ